MNPRNFLIAIAASVAIAAGAVVAYRPGASAPAAATVLPAAMALPEFTLIDQYGAALGPDRLRSTWSLMFFGFTHCPDICPATLSVLATAKRELATRGHEPLPRIVLVSVDPERDTPDVLGRYVDNFRADILGITGSIDQLRRLTDGLGIYFAKTAIEGGDYSVDHSAAVLVVNPDAELAAVFGSPHTVENFVRDLPLIQANR